MDCDCNRVNTPFKIGMFFTIFCSLQGTVHKSLMRSGLFDTFDQSIVFISVYDAYAYAQQEHRKQEQEEAQGEDLCQNF